MLIRPYEPRVLVYGTLKQGFSNHSIIKPYVKSVEAVTIPGEMWEVLNRAFPVVKIPTKNIILMGSQNIERDLAKAEEQFSVRPKSYPDAFLEPYVHPAPDNRTIKGELMTIDRPLQALERLDFLEGFRPTGGLYIRAMTWVETQEGWTPTWVYLDCYTLKRGEQILKGEWEVRI
jgi:gamma-glutamylcyclotransferase (GGCT)/AIG2-like uncharacterized protein YtfP